MTPLSKIGETDTITWQEQMNTAENVNLKIVEECIRKTGGYRKAFHREIRKARPVCIS